MNLTPRIPAVAAIAIASILTASGLLKPPGPDVSGEFGAPTLVNNSNHALGQVIDSSQSITFYSRRLNLLVSVDRSGNAGTIFGEYFTSTNCTGTPYYLIPGGESEPDTSAYISLLRSATGGYFKIEDTSPVSLAMHSAKDPGSCDLTISAGYALPVTPINRLPFTDPIPMPVHLSNQAAGLPVIPR